MQRKLWSHFRAVTNLSTITVITVECRQLMNVKLMTKSASMKQTNSSAVTGVFPIHLLKC